MVGEGHRGWGAHLVKKQGEKGKWTYINYLKGDQRTRKLTAEATNEKKTSYRWLWQWRLSVQKHPLVSLHKRFKNENTKAREATMLTELV